MSITSVLKKINPKTLKRIGFATYILTFIYFICCTIYEYSYFPITLPFLFATFCYLVAENNTEHIIDSIMMTVFVVTFSSFSYLDTKNRTDSLLENYTITKGIVEYIEFHTATRNMYSTVYGQFLIPGGKYHVAQKDYSLIPPFNVNDSVFILYQKDKVDNVQFFRYENEIDKWIKKSSFSKFWEEAYWLRRIVIAFVLFAIIPFILSKIKRH
ncbi:hypothetical protein [Dysgonomonas sp. 511]|uniref:hypothetical protein n=1 Tax=Dysgonomonas sp. 511 TaxID=2302930 RepID=UPI0013D670FD|nr:hypothetical protein [Dysgonomonas sp. 511]NDV79214.1 hypothetical protein [Dysgonomonas sp. 511]